MAEVNVVRASAKGLRLSPRKVSLVASLVRGRSVADALTILEFTPKRAAKPLAKLITAAKANAVNNYGLQEDGLSITQLQVTAGLLSLLPQSPRRRPNNGSKSKPH
jgi:large subunit ribosomal protein L22